MTRITTWAAAGAGMLMLAACDGDSGSDLLEQAIAGPQSLTQLVQDQCLRTPEDEGAINIQGLDYDPDSDFNNCL